MTPDELEAMGVVAHATTRVPEPQSLLGRLMRVELVMGRFENIVAMAALAVAVMAMGTSVAIRALDLPIPDTGEWALVAMSPLTFIGASLCSHLHRHLTADIVEALPPGRLLRALEAIAAALFIAFGLFFVAIAANLFEYAVSSGERLIDLGTPIAVPVGFMLIGSVLMTIHALLDFWRACAGYEPGGLNPW